MKLRTANKTDYNVIKPLYNMAFPKEERAPFFFIKHRAIQGRATMLIAEKDGEFIGFCYTVSCKNLIYLFYFAVAENKRGNGSGSEKLHLLKKYYEGKKIFLAREPLDDNADNSRQRISRRDYYIRNGFKDLPYKIREASVIYDLMSTDEDIDPKDYDMLIKKWAGNIIVHIVKMEVIS